VSSGALAAHHLNPDIELTGRRLPTWFGSLRRRGVAFETLPDVSRIHAEVVIEAPSSIGARVALFEPFRLGAFSHLNGGSIRNVQIGRYCSLARDVQIGHGFHPTEWLSVSPLQYVENYRGWSDFVPPADGEDRIATRPFRYELCTRVGNDVWIGNHVIVKDGVTIGDGAIVGAGSIVTRDVPSYAIVAGNPARVLRMRFHTTLVERLLKSEWWRFALTSFGPIDFSDVESAIGRIEDLIANGLQPYVAPQITASDFAAFTKAAALTD
jgi:acetyltransferase-like isoleucine patch superfamily enzyme